MPSPVHRVLTVLMVSLPLAFLTGSCQPDSARRDDLESFFSKEFNVFFSCKSALEERFGEQLRLPKAADQHHLRKLSPNRFEIRSVVDLLDAEGDRRLRSRFLCVAEFHEENDPWPSVALTVDALDSPRRHALWPWPGFDGLVSALDGRAEPSGSTK